MMVAELVVGCVHFHIVFVWLTVDLETACTWLVVPACIIVVSYREIWCLLSGSYWPSYIIALFAGLHTVHFTIKTINTGKWKSLQTRPLYS